MLPRLTLKGSLLPISPKRHFKEHRFYMFMFVVARIQSMSQSVSRPMAGLESYWHPIGFSDSLKPFSFSFSWKWSVRR